MTGRRAVFGEEGAVPRTGWREETSGGYDLRYYVEGSATDRVGIESVDDRSGIVVDGYGIRLVSRAGRLVVLAPTSGFRLSFAAGACASAAVVDQPVEGGELVLRLDIEVRTAVEMPATTYLVLYFPDDRRAELERVVAVVGDHGHTRDVVVEQGEHRSPGRRDQGSGYYFESPPIGSLDSVRAVLGAEFAEPAHREPVDVADPPAEPEPRPAGLARIGVRAVPDTEEWTTFRPLASSADVLRVDDEVGVGRWSGGER